jgi:hypothetical protein
MRRYLLIAMALGACAWAAADVRVFVTSSAAGYGLDLLGPQGDGTGTDPYHDDWPIDPFRPTYSSVDEFYGSDYAYDYYYAYYRAAAYPPIDAPSGTVNDPLLIDTSADQFGYIWFQFRNEPGGASVDEMVTLGTRAGQSQPTQDVDFTYYVQNGLWGSGFKRWLGTATPPDYPEWHNSWQYFDAATSWGIQNRSDNPQMMFHHQAVSGSYGTGVALLGALTGIPSDAVYELRITLIDYKSGSYPQIGESTFFKIVPEPAGGLLAVALVGCVRGRRR